MKKVLIDLEKFNFKDVEYFYIQTGKDLKEYAEHLGHEIDDKLSFLMTSKVPVDKWDHLATRDAVGGCLSAAIGKARVSDTPISPLIEMCNLADSKISNIAKYLLDGKIVLVNNAGGYCFF